MNWKKTKKALISKGSNYFTLLSKLMKEISLKIGFIIIALLLSILVGTILPSFVKITLGEQIIIALSLFIAISFVEFLYFYNLSLRQAKQEYKFWEIKNSGITNSIIYEQIFTKLLKMQKLIMIFLFYTFKKNSKNCSERFQKLQRKKNCLLQLIIFWMQTIF